MRLAEDVADAYPPVRIHSGHFPAANASLCRDDAAAGGQGASGEVGERVTADSGPPPARRPG
jgi:hypothetical protein